MKPTPQVACLWLPNWPIQRLVAASEELEKSGEQRIVSGNSRVLLYEAHSSGGLKVTARSAAAAKAGARIGMPLTEAISLLEGDRRSTANVSPRPAAGRGVGGEGRNHSRLGRNECHQSPLTPALSPAAGERENGCDTAAAMVALPHDFFADRQTLEELAGWCQQFSPVVSLEEVDRPECLLLDITGIASHFGGEAAMAERMEKAFAKRTLRVRVALAGTIGAAWALAHYERDRCQRITNCQAWEAGLVYERLCSFSTAALRLPLQTVECLAELGIHQIGQLRQLPRESLSSRFGPEVLPRLDQAWGDLPEAVVSHRSPVEFESEWILEHATDRREVIACVLESLMAPLAKQLADRREGVLHMECRFALQGAGSLLISVGLFRASATARYILELLYLQLENLRLLAPVQAVRLAATKTGRLEMSQQDLFADESDRSAPFALAALVDRLSNRLGRNAVLRPRLLADAQPELACLYLPYSAAGEKKAARVRARGSKKKPQHEQDRAVASVPPLRPVQLAPPLALEAMAVVPEGPPIRFRIAGVEHRVVQVRGPERIETGWWRKRGVRRDYYRVETQTGQRFWLFRRIGDERWFWQGSFE